MFEQLMQLPLFQGVSPERLTELVEKFPFHFLKFQPGESIITQSERCTHARFVVSGSVRVITPCRNLQVVLEQTLNAPHVLGPDSLFGMDTTYPFSAQALDTCGILQITKSDYVSMLQTDKVFLFNILNYLSRNSQRFTSSLLGTKYCSVEERLSLLVAGLTTQASTDVTLTFKQKDICALLGANRTSFLSSLERMSQQNIIDFTANIITVKDLRKLLNILKPYQK